MKTVPNIDIKKTMGIAKEYFFAQRKRAADYKERKLKALIKLWNHVSECATPIIQKIQFLVDDLVLDALQKKQQQLIHHLTTKAPELLSGLFDRCYEGAARRIKVYAYFRDAVHCFNKRSGPDPGNLGLNLHWHGLSD